MRVGFPLEVGARQVIQQDRISQVEEALLTFRQGGFNRGAVGVEAVEVSIEGIVGKAREVDAQDVGHGRGSNPVGHGVLRRGMNEPIECHRAGQRHQPRGEAQRFQDVVQAQPLPEFQTDVDVTGGPGRFVGHAIDVYRNQIARGGGGGRGGVDVHGGSGWHGEDVPELLEFRVLIGHSREGQLTGERVLEFSGQGEPLLGWSRREITERTDYLLSWSLVGEDGLDQKEIHIGFVFVSADCLADVHGHYRCQNIH